MNLTEKFKGLTENLGIVKKKILKKETFFFFFAQIDPPDLINGFPKA